MQRDVLNTKIIKWVGIASFSLGCVVMCGILTNINLRPFYGVIFGGVLIFSYIRLMIKIRNFNSVNNIVGCNVNTLNNNSEILPFEIGDIVRLKKEADSDNPYQRDSKIYWKIVDYKANKKGVIYYKYVTYANLYGKWRECNPESNYSEEVSIMSRIFEKVDLNA